MQFLGYKFDLESDVPIVGTFHDQIKVLKPLLKELELILLGFFDGV